MECQAHTQNFSLGEGEVILRLCIMCLALKIMLLKCHKCNMVRQLHVPILMNVL